MATALAQWHHAVSTNNPSDLKTLLADDCVFYSPILFKPQEGKALTTMYLTAAFRMFQKAQYFEYVKELSNSNDAVLEFNAEIDGIQIDGIDMISWNEAQQITHFKVMLRPMKAIEKVGEKMLEELQNVPLKQKLSIKMDVLKKAFGKH